MKNRKLHIIIAGAGASGLTAAISAAQAGARVTLLEQKEKTGKKLLATGNGHCNFSNDRMDVSCYHGNEFAMRVIDRFDVKKTLEFFCGLGIFPHERNGYYYPMSEQAQAVAVLLRKKAEELGVEILTERKVLAVRRERKSGFEVLVRAAVKESARKSAGTDGRKDGRKGNGKNGKKKVLPEEIRCEDQLLYGDRVILACGGRAYPALGSDGSGYELARSLGHRIVTPLPALTGIRCQESWFRQLAGVRISARVTILSDGKRLASDEGELQLTDYGISGIPVFQVSRYAARALEEGKKVQAEITFFPELSDEELKGYLQTHTVEQYAGLYPAKLLEILKQLAKAEKLFHLTRHLLCTCLEVNGFDRAQVTCGGVDLSEVSADTLESLRCPGVYLAGELLDVDGICGGYNLQWAWSSGWLAGQSAAGGLPVE
ncbi:MAG: aminoacetone oxidase family FAD-binding enzyme [Lachnospiraceae bacterium]